MKRLAALSIASYALAACEVGEAPPRAQALIVIDTDAPVIEQASADPAISRVVAVDTVRIDLLNQENGVRVFREFAATSPLDWPLSFALVPGDLAGAKVARLRVRAFRAKDALADVVNGTSTLSPSQQLAIDRVIEVTVPTTETVEARRVFLSAACFGRPASFRDQTSCAADGVSREPFNVALPATSTEDTRGRSAVGTWSRAREVPCPTAPSEGRVCIPGGISTIGNEEVNGYQDGSVQLPSIPVRLVEVPPFFMDRTEFTVGRARKWASQLKSLPLGPQPPSLDGLQFCDFDPRTAPDMPVNCVTQETALQLCELEGGTLPTEAQWSHAATGRGDGRFFPWGNQDPADRCCALSASRVGISEKFVVCKDATGPEPVGSHTGEDCPSPGDVSRDGVLDLGGSMTEYSLEQAQPLDDPCWGDQFGILVGATCMKRAGSEVTFGAFGGNWADGQYQSLNGFRRRVGRQSTVGFRCVYSAGERR